MLTVKGLTNRIKGIAFVTSLGLVLTSASITGCTPKVRKKIAAARLSLSTNPLLPPNPINLTASVDSTTQITLNWASGGGSTSDFIIAYQTGATAPADCETGTTISETNISGTSHPISGLSSGTQYSFRVCAINANGTPDVSSGVVVTSSTFQDAPPDPTNLTGTANSTSQITLSWSSGGGSTADYRIAYDLGNTAPSDCASGNTIDETNITGTSKAVTGLDPETEYSFRVCAINSNDTPDESSGTIVTATTLIAAPPNPTSLTAAFTSGTQLTLSWASGGGTTSDYRISYGTSLPATCAAGTTISENNIIGTSKLITGLTTGSHYYFRVCAINANGTPDVTTGMT